MTFCPSDISYSSSMPFHPVIWSQEGIAAMPEGSATVSDVESRGADAARVVHDAYTAMEARRVRGRRADQQRHHHPRIRRCRAVHDPRRVGAARLDVAHRIADPSGIAAMPSWLQLTGWNGIDDEYEMSDGQNVILTELVHGGGLVGDVISLTARTLQHHANGLDVWNAAPLSDIAISGFDIASDGGTIAVGTSR